MEFDIDTLLGGYGTAWHYLKPNVKVRKQLEGLLSDYFFSILISDWLFSSYSSRKRFTGELACKHKSKSCVRVYIIKRCVSYPEDTLLTQQSGFQTLKCPASFLWPYEQKMNAVIPN